MVGALADACRVCTAAVAQGLALLISACDRCFGQPPRRPAANRRSTSATTRGATITAGRYTDAVLPREAVIFAVQESGSARYYARPVVRWDLLPVDLDTAVATLTAMHRHPVFLVEDWEAADLRMRFPSSRTRAAGLAAARRYRDTHIHVLLFDPADRDDHASPETDSHA